MEEEPQPDGKELQLKSMEAVSTQDGLEAVLKDPGGAPGAAGGAASLLEAGDGKTEILPARVRLSQEQAEAVTEAEQMKAAHGFIRRTNSGQWGEAAASGKSLLLRRICFGGRT